jgi:hypothetical protein
VANFFRTAKAIVIIPDDIPGRLVIFKSNSRLVYRYQTIRRIITRSGREAYVYRFARLPCTKKPNEPDFQICMISELEYCESEIGARHNKHPLAFNYTECKPIYLEDYDSLDSLLEEINDTLNDLVVGYSGFISEFGEAIEELAHESTQINVCNLLSDEETISHDYC